MLSADDDDIQKALIIHHLPDDAQNRHGEKTGGDYYYYCPRATVADASSGDGAGTQDTRELHEGRDKGAQYTDSLC